MPDEGRFASSCTNYNIGHAVFPLDIKCSFGQRPSSLGVEKCSKDEHCTIATDNHDHTTLSSLRRSDKATISPEAQTMRQTYGRARHKPCAKPCVKPITTLESNLESNLFGIKP